MVILSIGVNDVYVFYADVYFLQNFMIKVAVLYLSAYSNRLYFLVATRKGILKIIVVALAGTAVEIIGLLVMNSYNIFLIGMHLFEIPCMVRILLPKGQKQNLRMMISGYFFVMMINGVLEILWNWFGKYGDYIFLLFVSCGIVYIGLRIYFNYSRMQKGIFPVEIYHKGKRIITYGFYDSGNRLIDPFTQKGVHIISEHLWKKIGLDMEHAVLVPYQTMGNADGLVKVYYVEELIFGDESKRKSWSRCPMGVTKEDLFKEGSYEIILNEEVF